MRYWRARRATAEVIKPLSEKSEASFGRTVTLRRNDGRVQSFRIVGEDEADPSRGTISYVSPLARAVLTHGPGETVEIAGGEGHTRCTIGSAEAGAADCPFDPQRGSAMVLTYSAGSSHANGDARDAAESAGLRYVSDARPGIRRQKAGKGFTYLRADGSTLSESDVLKRIKVLAIPPAWTEVWICPWAGGHIQATGRDAKGRKQYRYHARFREVRESTKYEHVVAFADALPAIREKVREHMALRGLPREKVLATVVHLLEPR